MIRRQAAAGAGREVDAEGFSPGPWTPEQLAGAISQLGENRSGIELRTVQLWFQDNQKGISAQNIRWLARIFGCGDTNATADWQVALTAAKSRMTSKRRERRTALPEPDPILDRDQTPTPDATVGVETPDERRQSLALRTDKLFKGPSLTLPIIVWVSCGTLWFVAYAAGIHDITYQISNGMAKQVGFFWSPSWIIGEMLLLPIVLLTVSDMLKDWTLRLRNDLTGNPNRSPQSWENRLVDHSLAFKLILAVCFVGIFILQWIGVYLLPFIDGQTDSSMIDWLLVALKRPDVVSTQTAIIVSFLAFLYSGLIYWLYFSSLLILYIIVSDFSDLITLRKTRDCSVAEDYGIAERILFSLFRCATLGVLIAISIKLNAAYLLSDAESITGWLLQDALHPLRLREEPWLLLYDEASPFFTSFLLLVLTCSVFIICAVRLLKPLESLSVDGKPQDTLLRKLRLTLCLMIMLISFLSLGYLVTGRFYGFSIVVCLSVMASLASLFWKPRIS